MHHHREAHTVPTEFHYPEYGHHGLGMEGPHEARTMEFEVDHAGHVRDMHHAGLGEGYGLYNREAYLGRGEHHAGGDALAGAVHGYLQQ